MAGIQAPVHVPHPSFPSMDNSFLSTHRPVPRPQEAFWCLVQICEVYLPGYYGPHMVRGWVGRWKMEGDGCEAGALGVEVCSTGSPD